MAKIDPQTVQRILDTADIVEVVSDYVSLKRRGANYVGLCPFHNDRSPSFYVSKSKGICKCFSCGKGGSAVNFLMELEQISYHEALKQLAQKYHIEVKERELTDKERQEASDRESLFAVNDMALRQFEFNLHSTDDGCDIGLSYFRERGINDWAIKRFRLGYSMAGRYALRDHARAEGFNDRFLIESGLCIKPDNGEPYDRFRGRVMYPIFTISGKVVGFGGRTLKKDKDVAKYMNSPESLIYHKSNELYGLYQAKQAMAKYDRCILVEGYMDVISMHQSGIENVVASSGTSLTEGQIRLIRRITSNVTVIYDSDAAGIKASLRGIDMLLADGMNVKVVSLPDGDDPDSFAQSHTTEEINAYLEREAQDFIAFKTRILLTGVENDPIARARVITDIVQSISVIPDQITRTVYIHECSQSLGIDEKVLTLQVQKLYRARRDNEALQQAREQAKATLEGLDSTPKQPIQVVDQTVSVAESNARLLQRYERRLLRYVLKYGVMDIAQSWEESGSTEPVLLIDYIDDEFAADGIGFSTPLYVRAYEVARRLRDEEWPRDSKEAQMAALKARELRWHEGIARIREQAADMSDIKARELALQTECDEAYNKELTEYANFYIERRLASTEDDELRRLTTDLVSEKYQLSKVHTKYAKVETEVDRLGLYVERALYEFKDAILECQVRELREEIRQAASDPATPQDLIAQLMTRNAELNAIKAQFAKYLGERIVAPRK